jgi:signal transduction histidine kinase
MEVLAHRFFRYFPLEHARRLAKAVQRVTYPAQRVIFEENDASDVIYLVLSGRVEIAKHSSGDHFHSLAFANGDDYFGELGALDGSGRSARAVARTEVRAALVPRRIFLEILSQCPWETTMGLFRHVIADLRETNARYVQELIRKEKITLIGEMANSILHDFRSPVTAIQLSLGTISKHASNEPVRLAGETIERQLRRMSVMVEEVLLYARGEARLDRRPVHLRELFSNLLAFNTDLLRNSGVAVKIRAADQKVVLDHDRMIRVLQNLVSNAVEAMVPGRKGVITLAGKATKGFCEISVADNGPGIPTAICGTLFQPFTTYGKKGGTGLGLAIAQGIVAAHGGTIGFETGSRRGTTFRIRLPLPS